MSGARCAGCGHEREEHTWYRFDWENFPACESVDFLGPCSRLFSDVRCACRKFLPPKEDP